MKKTTWNLTLSAMFLAAGMVLPFLTGQVPQIGNMLLPMHLPVFLCGLICGAPYGAAVGFVLPILRSFVFGMPIMYPAAIAMAFELAAYGLLAGYLYNSSKWQCIISLYRSLIIAMIGGRLVWGAVQIVLLGIGGNGFTWKMFLSGALLQAVPGIILQLIFIPLIMVFLHRTGLVKFQRHVKEEATGF